MKINQNISAIMIVFITGLIISCSLNPAEEVHEQIVVTFPDPNFEALIREKLELPEREITNYDMWTIEHLSGVGRNISDISGIEYCSGLTILTLKENLIINIRPISDLVLLNHIDLQNNLIMDIKPLIDNTGVGIGNDAIYLYNNPLSDKSILQYKPQLQARGVKFYSNAKLSSPGEINFMDDNFEAVIRVHLNNHAGPILTSDLESITNIWARNSNIQNIYSIEYCTNLDTLNIGENQITDLIPLFYLGKMKSLKLDNNNIDDTYPIGYFYNLSELVISNNKIEDLSYISGLINLTHLLLDNNIITDISPLSNLLNLQYLTLSGNPIDNFKPIANIDSLKTIELMNLYQFDFDHIKDISNLQDLYLTNTPVINLDLIANITSLQNLIMNNCSIPNIDSLASLDKLSKLYLTDNNISDITSLTELYELSELELGNNYVSDILPLINNWGIGGDKDYVYLYNNPLSEESINTYIPQLENRGVHVYY